MNRRYGPSHAGQRGSVDGMRVDHGVHIGTSAVDARVHGRLAGRLEGALQNHAFHIDEHHVLWSECVVVDPAGRYEEIAFLSTGADVARSSRHQAGSDELFGDAGYLLAQVVVPQEDPPSGGWISYFMPSWRPCCSRASTTPSAASTVSPAPSTLATASLSLLLSTQMTLVPRSVARRTNIS